MLTLLETCAAWSPHKPPDCCKEQAGGGVSWRPKPPHCTSYLRYLPPELSFDPCLNAPALRWWCFLLLKPQVFELIPCHEVAAHRAVSSPPRDSGITTLSACMGCSRGSHSPIHPASQVRLRQHPALVLIHPLDLLDAAQVGHHHVLAFSCTPGISIRLPCGGVVRLPSWSRGKLPLCGLNRMEDLVSARLRYESRRGRTERASSMAAARGFQMCSFSVRLGLRCSLDERKVVAGQGLLQFKLSCSMDARF